MNIEHEVTMNNQCWVIEHDEGSMSAAMVIMGASTILVEQ